MSEYILDKSSADIISMLAPDNMIGVGSVAKVFAVTPDTCFKFKFADIQNACDNLNIKADNLTASDLTRALEYILANENFLKRKKRDSADSELQSVMEKQKDIKLSSFTKSIVRCAGLTIGYILPYHKGMITLKDFLNSSNDYPIELLDKIKENIISAIEELRLKFIYHVDLNDKNILVNLDGDVQIIDFEDDVCTTDAFYDMGDRAMLRQERLLCVDIDHAKEKIL